MVTPGWLVGVFAALLGAVLGSFLNVCIYRWPAEQSVVAPRSRCPSCGTTLAWHDNIPILSWLWLRGRCRTCAQPISIQYPAIELATSLIWLAAALRFGVSLEALRGALFLTLLLGIAVTDAREMVIPDQFSLGGALVGLLLTLPPGGFPLGRALLGGGLAYVLLWVVKLVAERIVQKPALGVGDIHMMVMVGIFLGSAGALLTVLLGSVLGLLVGLPLLWLRRRVSPLGTYLPLGTFLALGGAVAYVWGELIVRWYMNSVIGA